jgi:hypothetical protein
VLRPSKNWDIIEMREIESSRCLDKHTANKSYDDSMDRFYFSKNLVLKKNTENKTRVIEEP